MFTGANNFNATQAPFQILREPRERLFRARLGMLFFLAAETMFFAGLISAYVVLSAQVASWPPPDQPRLPIAITGFNTLVLLWSAFALVISAYTYKKKSDSKSFIPWLVMATLGGLVFLAIQGREWAELIRYGLATSHSVYAGTFYLVIGMHALHVMSGAMALTFLLFKVVNQTTTTDIAPFFAAARLYWYFVVGVWPVLYGVVYWH